MRCLTFAPPTFLVVSTQYVVPPARWRDDPYVEIVAAPSHDAGAPRCTLITRDAVLAEQLGALEGSDTRVSLTWRYDAARRRNVLTEARIP